MIKIINYINMIGWDVSSAIGLIKISIIEEYFRKLTPNI